MNPNDLNSYAADFGVLLSGLRRLESDLQMRVSFRRVQREKEDFPVDRKAPAFKEAESLYRLAFTYADGLGLDATLAKADRLLTRIKRVDHLLGEELLRDVRDLKERLLDELENRFFLYVPLERARYFMFADLFGAEVKNRFPSAAKDIEEAGNCLALGRNTASVFHSMRVLEFGIRGVAYVLKITHKNDWGKYLDAIDAELKKRSANQPKSASAKAAARKRHDYFAELGMKLHAVKDACRNKTMHVERTYEWGEAEEILKATRSLMQHIAKKCRERPKRGE